MDYGTIINDKEEFMSKKKHFFQIGEVAKLFGISRKMLLYYEKNQLIAPTDVNELSGYRYYSLTDIARVGIILDLRKTGMSIPDIKEYFTGKVSLGEQIMRLEEQERRIRATIAQLKIRDVAKGNISEIKEIQIPAQTCICKELIAPDIEAAVAEFSSFYEDCIKKGFCFNVGSYHSFCEFQAEFASDDFFETQNIRMKICISVDGAKADVRSEFFPETKALYVTFCGEYNQSIIAYTALKKYINLHNLEVTGYPREYYIDCNFHNKGNDNVIGIVIPVR